MPTLGTGPTLGVIMDTYHIARQGNRIICAGNPDRAATPGISPSLSMYGFLVKDGEAISAEEWIRRIRALSTEGAQVTRHLQQIRFYMGNDAIPASA